MTIQDAKVMAGTTLELSARAFKDKGFESYEARCHSAACGRVISKAIAGGLEPSQANMGELFQAIANHSAWRQKFEKLGIFTKASEKAPSQSLADMLEEEGC